MSRQPKLTIHRPAYEPFIARHFPAWYEQRERARVSAAVASFQGGIATRTSESFDDARGYRFGSATDRAEIGTARGRAYQAYRNNPVARALIQTETDNVIGDGLNYQPTTDSEEWNREAKDRYYEWLNVASVRGGDIHSGCELQRLLWNRSRVAGDIGWILVARDADSRVQVVPAENIRTPDNLWSDPAVNDGIRYDEQGKPLQFYVYATTEQTGKRTFTPVDARDFVYLHHMEDPQQARGETAYMTVFEHLSQLSKYIDGVALAAWMATVMGIVFKQNNAAKQLAALPTLTNSQGDQQKAITFENGMVKYIGTDEDVVQVQASQPMQQTPDFIKAMMRQIGQPFDMPLEVLARDMSTCNFASARIGLLPFYRACRIKAARFGTRWSRTIQWWLSREAHRSPDDPKRWKTAFPEDFWKHDLLVNAWDYTDPVSEAQADLLQIDMGTKSHQMVITERGRDGQQILKDRTEWQDKTADLPAVHSTMTRDPAPEPVTPAAPAAPPTKDTSNAQ